MKHRRTTRRDVVLASPGIVAFCAGSKLAQADLGTDDDALLAMIAKWTAIQDWFETSEVISDDHTDMMNGKQHALEQQIGNTIARTALGLLGQARMLARRSRCGRYLCIEGDSQELILGALADGLDQFVEARAAL